MRILVEGRPGSGKTTVARRLVERLLEGGMTVAGFTTEEMRDGRRRVGFAVEAVDGARATLAHVDFSGPPRVGKYGVDLSAFEAVALPALERPADVVVIDELGKMELASEAFRDAVMRCFASAPALVATVHTFKHPFTDRLKGRDDVEVVRVTVRDRDRLPDELAGRVLAAKNAQK